MPDLQQTNPALISDLFAKDPLKLTREERTSMVEFYRKNRALYVQTGKGSKPSVPKKPVPEGGLSLSDLDL